MTLLLPGLCLLKQFVMQSRSGGMGALNRAILNLEGRLRGWMAAGPPAWTCCLWSWAPGIPRAGSPGLAKEGRSAQTAEPGSPQPSLSCGSGCLSERSPPSTAVGRRTRSPSSDGVLAGVTTRAARGAPLPPGSRARSARPAPREPPRRRTDGLGRSFNKSCLLFSGGSYGLLSNLFHPQSLFLGKAEEREGEGGWA